MESDAVIEELYGLTPAEFTGARDRHVQAARQAGDRQLAAAVKALRRPSAGAWAINLLARQRADDLGRLLDLGERMREAHAALSGDEIRALGRQRHQLVSGLARDASLLATQRGAPISGSAEREVVGTLEAALADPEAGAAARSGRLQRSLAHLGFGPVDVDGAVAGRPVEPGAVRQGSATERVEGTTERPNAATEQSGARDRFQAAVTDAEETAASAEVQADEAQAAFGAATESTRQAAARVQEAIRRIEELEEDLRQARQVAEGLESAADAATLAEGRARLEMQSARDRVDRSRADLEALRRRGVPEV
jgi:hypothetical protein